VNQLLVNIEKLDFLCIYTFFIGSRIFPQTGIFRGFSLYYSIILTRRQLYMGLAGRPLFHVK
jgi:hypothetical protein